MRVRSLLVRGLAAVACVSCKTPVDLAGDFTGVGTERAALSGGTETRKWSRAPLDERVTITRGAGRDLHIKYGTCDLPARSNPDGLSATIVYGKCWVSGFPGPIPVEGTFKTDQIGGAMTVQIAGSLAGAMGTVAYSYEFAGKRSAN